MALLKILYEKIPRVFLFRPDDLLCELLLDHKKSIKNFSPDLFFQYQFV